MKIYNFKQKIPLNFNLKYKFLYIFQREINFKGHKTQEHIPNDQYEKFHEEIHRLEKYIEELEDKLKARPNSHYIERNVDIKQKQKIGSGKKVKLVPHAFLDKEIEEFEILPDVLPNHQIHVHKEIHENDKSLLGKIKIKKFLKMYCFLLKYIVFLL